MNRQRIVEAVNFLIEAANYDALIAEIRQIIDQWATHPMAYGGRLRHLNAMVDVGLQNPTAFNELVELIENRRKHMPRAKRNEYQKELMQARRAREGKAIALHEMHSGPLRGTRRTAYLSEIRARWAARRAEFIQSKGGPALSWKERNQAANEFWAMIDRQLEANLQAEVRKRA